jgi:hypothetical protein
MSEPKSLGPLFEELIRALGTVSAQMDDAAAAKTADELIDKMSRTTDESNLALLARALRALGAPRGTEGIIRILQHPMAAGAVQRALLNELGQPTKRTFHSTWHFIDWAASNGVDFLPEQR